MKYLIIHPDLSRIAGGELFSVHAMHRLLEHGDHEVSLLSLKAPDYEEIERATGLALQSDRIRFIPAQLPAFMSEPGRFGMWRMAFLQRAARRIAREHDVCICGFNEMDFGIPGMQYIHFPAHANPALLARYQILAPDNIYFRHRAFYWAYRFLQGFISNYRTKHLRANYSWVNSEFMSGIVNEAYGIQGKVCYSAFVPPESEWNYHREREFRMVSIGRFASDKYLLELMDQWAALHQAHPTLKFTLAGRISEPEYLRLVQEKAAALGVPVEILPDCPREKLKDLLETSRFYLHPKPLEHFGIVILEAAYAGCLPFVHQSGGMIEIAPSTAQQYTSLEDLLEKFAAVVARPQLEAELLAAQAAHRVRFSTENFYRDFEQGVAEFIASRCGARPPVASEPAHATASL